MWMNSAPRMAMKARNERDDGPKRFSTYSGSVSILLRK